MNALCPYDDDSLGNTFWHVTINNIGAGTRLADDDNIDWTTVSVALPTAGTYSLGFRIRDYCPDGGMFESILGVDNVSIVPVPPAFLLGSLGLGVAGQSCPPISGRPFRREAIGRCRLLCYTIVMSSQIVSAVSGGDLWFADPNKKECH